MEDLLVPYKAITEIPCSSVLVLAPHPDDEVFGCGGAIIRHCSRGVGVRVIIVTDGAYGLKGDKRDAHILVRKQESLAAAAILGCSQPEFWGLPDRELLYGEKLVLRIMGAGNGADLIYAPSVFEIHPDHRALGMAAVEAVRRLGQGVRLALYEVGMPLRPNLLLDISDIAERKKAAMECFISQNAIQRFDLDIAALNRYRSYTLPASVSAAEAFIVATADELDNDPLQLYRSEHNRQRELGLMMDSRDMPLVSVIVRSMDRPELSDTLDSLALQTYANLEVVVVNAKGYGHREVGEWCGRFPLRMVGTGQSLSRSRAANIGLEAARGQYVGFLDDDDWFMPDHVAGLVSALSGGTTRYLAAYSGAKCVDQQGRSIDESFASPYDSIRLLAGNYIPIHAVLFDRALYARGCQFDEAFDLYEDWDFWLQVALHTEFLFVEQMSVCYRKGGQGSGAGNPANTELYGSLVLEKWRQKWSPRQVSELIRLVRESTNHKDRLRQMEETNRSNESYVIELRGQIALTDDANRSNEKYIEELRGQITLTDDANRSNEKYIEELRGQLALMEDASRSNAKYIEELRGQIALMEDASRSNAKYIEELRGQIALMKDASQSNAKYIGELRGQIALMEDASQSNGRYIEDLRRHIQGLESALGAR